MLERGSLRVLGAVLAGWIVLAAAQAAPAAIVIDVGTHYLLPNTPGQAVQIFVSTTDANRVGGCNLNAQIDGAGPAFGGVAGPAITNVDLQTGTIFAGNNDGESNLAPFEVPMLAMYSILTHTSTVPASGLLVTLTVDTTGYTTPGQSWTLNLNNTLNGATDFAPTAATITDGLIIIPEPCTLAVLAVGAAGMLLRRRRRARA
jgi:hypothetical protein